MLSDITLGQYYPSGSPIHKLDPRVKIVAVLALVCLLFTLNSPLTYLISALFIFFVLFISKVPFSFVFKGMKPLVFILTFTALINIFLTDGRILLKIGFLTVTYEGIRFAVFMVIRLTLLVCTTSILTLTTSPIMLTNGLESLLRPLKRFKLPVHELAMMMTIALRFIPTIMEETDKIMKAQSARGADFTTGNLIQRTRAMLPILIPLFINAFKRADELALAMECRCYRGGEGRTQLKPLKFRKSDFAASLICFVFCAFLIFSRFTRLF